MGIGWPGGTDPRRVEHCSTIKCRRSDESFCVQVIYVGNLPNSANETNIKELFDTFSGGEVRIQL